MGSQDGLDLLFSLWPSLRTLHLHVLQIVLVLNTLCLFLPQRTGRVALYHTRALCDFGQFTQIFLSNLFSIDIQLKISELAVYLEVIECFLPQEIVFYLILSFVNGNLDLYLLRLINNDGYLLELLLELLSSLPLLLLLCNLLFVPS
jgi:hypothetical protein